MGVCQFDCVSLAVGFEDGMWDLVIVVPDHLLFNLCIHFFQFRF